MKKIVMFVIAMVMMATVFCGCETHERATWTSYTTGTVVEFYDGEVVGISNLWD